MHMFLWLQVGQYDDLVKYLMMVRDKVKDPKVDTEIVIAYAMTDKLGDLEAFITSALLLSVFCSFAVFGQTFFCSWHSNRALSLSECTA